MHGFPMSMTEKAVFWTSDSAYETKTTLAVEFNLCSVSLSPAEYCLMGVTDWPDEIDRLLRLPKANQTVQPAVAYLSFHITASDKAKSIFMKSSVRTKSPCARDPPQITVEDWSQRILCGPEKDCNCTCMVPPTGV